MKDSYLPIITVFTPSYNRKHTLCRTFDSLKRQTRRDFRWLIIDDGSTDGTREWVLSLGDYIKDESLYFDWMGLPLSGESDQQTNNHFLVDAKGLQIEYIYKPNGGLYSGYNVAYSLIQTELCVCIDSDDYAPDDMVEKIIKIWNDRDIRIDYCGIVGLDYNVVNGEPIGGEFAKDKTEGYYFDVKNGGDTKEVLRTDLMKTVSPMIGFKGEKDFNPFYMISQVVAKYPILVENSNLCWVEYQTGDDSMSKSIFKQYRRSPKSYARYRLMELSICRKFRRKYSLCSHYISACIFSHDRDWLRNSRNKVLTISAIPLGLIYNLYIRYKTR